MMSTREIRDYYQDKNVGARILEFLGGDALEPATCRFIVGGNRLNPRLDRHLPVSRLETMLWRGFEIGRSLWDKTSLLADFDIEYVNFDNPATAFAEPERVFELQQPIVEAVEATLKGYGIPTLHFLTGRGHHFLLRIQRNSTEFTCLVRLGRGNRRLWEKQNQPHRPDGRRISKDLARAFAGLGLVMEFLAYQIKRAAAPRTKVPVELTAVEVGPSPHGREMISLDISEYGDALHKRMVRVPFTVYLKPWQQRWAFTPDALKQLPTLVVTPLGNKTWQDGIRIMRDVPAMRRLAQTAHAIIPDAGQGMSKLISDYEKSAVAEFHNWFYEQEQHEPKRWKETYDLLPLDILPACVRVALEQPNDLLLRPAYIRRLVRVMLALGWHPRHIAGLIYSKYARPFGWTQFKGYDRATRADFYTRIFAGSFVTGLDDLVDLNCVSAQEQKVCSFTGCGFNLLDFKQSALNRRAHDQLAYRPFNRLLLQPTHR